MTTNKKRIAELQATQAQQAGQINNLSKGILSLCLACGVTAISAARANKKAKNLEVKINGMVVEEEPKKKDKKKKKEKVSKEQAPVAPETPQTSQPQPPQAPKVEQPQNTQAVTDGGIDDDSEEE